VKLKFQRSYCLPDKSSSRLGMSGKRLWKLVKGPDKSDGPNLLLDRLNAVWPVCYTGLTDMTDFSTLLEFGFLTSLMDSLWILSTLVLSRSPYCIPLYSMVTYTQERNKIYKNKLELVNLILLCAVFIFV
jgi:hypothetical protein